MRLTRGRTAHVLLRPVRRLLRRVLAALRGQAQCAVVPDVPDVPLGIFLLAWSAYEITCSVRVSRRTAWDKGLLEEDGAERSRRGR